jgi:hypothetical protein
MTKASISLALLFVISLALVLAVPEAARATPIATIAATLPVPCSDRDYASATNQDEIYLAVNRCFYYKDAVTSRQLMDYNRGAILRRAQAFEWHATVSKYIFVVVLALLLVSVTLSVWQFLRHDDSAITLKISTGSTLELSTSVVGFVLFVFSMVMFYLYLERVYQITNASSGASDSVSLPASSGGK